MRLNKNVVINVYLNTSCPTFSKKQNTAVELRPFRSLEVQYLVTTACANKSMGIAGLRVLLDFLRTFGAFSHELLLATLHDLCLGPEALRLLQSYFIELKTLFQINLLQYTVVLPKSQSQNSYYLRCKHLLLFLL